jgi:hypothetical protein
MKVLLWEMIIPGLISRNTIKKTCWSPNLSSVILSEDRIEDIPQLSADENSLLIVDYSMHEICKAIFQMEHN